MKNVIFLVIFLSLTLSGCAYNGFSVKNENKKFALAIQRFEFLRHNGVPVPPKAGDKIPVVIKKVIKKKVSYSKLKAVQTVRVYKTLKKPVVRKVPPAVAQIHGVTTGLPVLTVDFVNKPLWKVLQDVSNKTGYVFTATGVNLAKKVNLKGRYNFAVLLAKLFNGRGENTTLNLKTKRIHIWR